MDATTRKPTDHIPESEYRVVVAGIIGDLDGRIRLRSKQQIMTGIQSALSTAVLRMSSQIGASAAGRSWSTGDIHKANVVAFMRDTFQGILSSAWPETLGPTQYMPQWFQGDDFLRFACLRMRAVETCG